MTRINTFSVPFSQLPAFSLLGLLKKSASGVPGLWSASRLRAEALRRANAQAGRHFPVLTYYAYAPRVKMAAAFPSSELRTELDGPFGKTQGMLF